MCDIRFKDDDPIAVRLIKGFIYFLLTIFAAFVAKTIVIILSLSFGV